MNKRLDPIDINALRAEAKMFVADTFAHLVDQARGLQGRVVGFAPDVNTVHKYSIMRYPAVSQGFFNAAVRNVNKRTGMLTGVFSC